MKKTILYVLQQAANRALSPEAVTRYANQLMDTPTTVPGVRATLAELEAQGFAARRASVLDPSELTWVATRSGMEVSTL